MRGALIGVAAAGPALAAAVWIEGRSKADPRSWVCPSWIGLMAVMKNLADPSKLGHGIAAAFTATVYGIGSANLALLPAATKLKGIIVRQGTDREMIIEGLAAIAQGENPRNIETRLQGFGD